MISDCVYLDYNATTPVDPRVIEAMLPYFYDQPGNASSRNHPYGWLAEEAVSQAKNTMVSIFGIEDKELIFTSGATESINLAIKGVFEAYQKKGKHIITVKTEHKAVLDVCESLEKKGAEVTYLEVDQQGMIKLEDLEKSIRTDTILVAVMWVNNETGVIFPMDAIGALCKQKNVLLFCDATQAVGKMAISPGNSGIHLMAFSAHKFYGPKGIGGLYVSQNSPRVKLISQIHGGGHQNELRSGTLNVPGIVGMAKALEIAVHSFEMEQKHLARLRDKLEDALVNDLEEVKINGDPQNRVSHVSNLSFRFLDAEALMSTFNQRIAASTGSACSSASLEPSHVLMAMGVGERDAKASIRFSLGRFTTAVQIDQTIDAIRKGVEKLRKESPVWEMFKEGLL